jgi:DNA polymerase III sliding clamp (beta) subunit (PCNA family)
VGTPVFLARIDLIHSLSEIQRCIDSRNTAELFGNVLIAVRSMRSNFTNGFS